MFNCYCLYFWV